MLGKFEDTPHYREIILRGVYISMAADTEWILSMILSSLFIGKEQEIEQMIKRKNKSFHLVNLSEKIRFVKAGLKKYHNSFYIQHTKDFQLLNNLRNIRNKFGHGKIEFLGNKEDLSITEITKTGIVKKPYKMSALMIDLEEYRKSVLNFLDTIKTLFLPQ